ncbi:peroxidase-related enzyme [Bradyrhizobium manausense]|uniref:carboxymuconolactone decarboxylase family protein n=1 Tax=Bradyrhizobium manausense TaxID=989370 RepID=UPI001BA946C6|nr:peroxidase-related enzyme [Bradyrhizobium manausense]MBR1085903.1 peroxidase-related enzyme [Bradyrhizobium manausense]
MPRIPTVDTTKIDTTTKATLDAVKAKVGMVPNLHSTLAHAPAALNGYLALGNALAAGLLTPRQREIVALATGQANQCQYCLSAHTLLGKGAGLSPEGVRAAREGKAQDAQDNAVAALAARLIETRGAVSDADLAAAHNAGLDDARILEVVAHVAMNVLTNFTNNVAHTDIDFPVVPVAIAA